MIASEAQFNETLRSLHSDLHQAFSLAYTYRKPVPEGSIRLASVILRKWLVDGLLTQLAHCAGVTATVPVLDNQSVIAEIPQKEDVTYFLTGGIRMNGSPVSGIYHSTLNAPTPPRLPLHTMAEIDVKVSQFLSQKRVYYAGTFFTASDIISYTANKLGGAHLDFNRAGKFAEMERAAEFLTYGGPPAPPAEPPGEMYLILEPASDEILSGFHIEIIAAASSFVRVEFDGQPLVPLTVKQSIRSLFDRLLRRNRAKYTLYDRGPPGPDNEG